MIPEPEYNDSLMGEERRPRPIVNLTCMIVVPASVQLDCKLCSRAIEIQRLTLEGMLAAKFVNGKISVSQVPPKNALGVGRLLA